MLSLIIVGMGRQRPGTLIMALVVSYLAMAEYLHIGAMSGYFPIFIEAFFEASLEQLGVIIPYLLFHNVWASRSLDRRTLCCKKRPIDGLQSPKIVKGLLGICADEQTITFGICTPKCYRCISHIESKLLACILKAASKQKVIKLSWM